MKFLHDLQARKLPPMVPEGMTAEQWPAYRRQLLELFSREEYGFTPPPPGEVRAEILDTSREWAGKAEEREVKLSFDTPGGEFSFPVNVVLPYGGAARPMIIYMSFEPYIDGYYMPIEEIIDSGYAFASFHYNDVSLDERDGWLTNGLAAMYPRKDDNVSCGAGGTDWGQCGMWAFAASRMLDYVQTLEQVDGKRVFVVGHSRLGKTALWCAAQDERFAGAGVNDSGFGGMAVTRGKQGEQMRHLPERIERWFCKNFLNWVDREGEMPFDQHMLAALVAPRLLAVCNAEEDTWADPQSEFMSLYEADKAYTLLDVPGLIAPAAYPQAPARFPEGRIGYSLRKGTHYMSREDWGFYLKFFGKADHE